MENGNSVDGQLYYFLRNLNFSHRETGIIRELLKTETNAQIGKNLHIAPGTVGNHRQSIYAKAGVHSRSELIIWLYNKGLDKNWVQHIKG